MKYLNVYRIVYLALLSSSFSILFHNIWFSIYFYSVEFLCFFFVFCLTLLFHSITFINRVGQRSSILELCFCVFVSGVFFAF